jgi:aminopeptidase-like protein
MKISDNINLEKLSGEMYDLIKKLFPLCRSITGDGVRHSLSIVKDYIPLQIHDIPTDTAVFDWKVPKEWNIRDAYIKNSKGKRIVDFRKNNLHVVSYSIPVHKHLKLDELKSHLFTLPEHPDWIPNQTSYYKETWGFCLTHNQFLDLSDEEEYEVYIDSTLSAGSLTYGELFIKGYTLDEVLIFTHICHPSLCNDNLSGIALTTHLAQLLSEQKLRYSYRFVFAPTAIGSITWLSINESILANIKHGLNIALCGDANDITYKKSRKQNAEIDQIACYALQQSGKKHKVLNFYPYGYDERQFCSPGIDLALGRLTRSIEGGYPEYHTSADNLDVVSPVKLADTFEICVSIIEILENNFLYKNNNPKCEPQLGRRGIYKKNIGGRSFAEDWQLAILWVLNLSDGTNSLLDIAKRSELEFGTILEASKELLKCGLLKVLQGDNEIREQVIEIRSNTTDQNVKCSVIASCNS